MSKVTAYELTQPFKGTPDEVMDGFFPSRTVAQLESITDPINLRDKRRGRMVFSSQLDTTVWADAATPEGTWSNAAGIVLHEPK